ncbi:10417_t:CDS:2, partial [Gigaspora margarita]
MEVSNEEKKADKGCPWKIPHSNEDNYKVEDIPIQKDENFYSLQLEIDETIPCVPELVRKLGIDKGYKKRDDNFIAAANIPAFIIKELHMMNIIIENKFGTISNKTTKSVEQLWIESFENVNIKESDKIVENCEEKIVLNKYTIHYVHKGTILLSHKNLKPTKEYLDAIKNALDGNYNDTQKFENLRQIGDEYGFFGWHKIKLGGKCLTMTQDQTNDKYVIAIGGNIAMNANQIKWLGSLESYKTWAIIEYKDKFSLYELLPENLQLEIKRLHQDDEKVNQSEIKHLYPNVEKVNMILGEWAEMFEKGLKESNIKSFEYSLYNDIKLIGRGGSSIVYAASYQGKTYALKSLKRNLVLDVETKKTLINEVVDNTPPIYSNLYKKCWSSSPDQRPTLYEILDQLEMLSKEALVGITNYLY